MSASSTPQLALPPASSLLRVTAPHFVAGAEVSGPSLTLSRAAPIISYMRGWTVFSAQAYCHEKGWSWLWLKGGKP